MNCAERLHNFQAMLMTSVLGQETFPSSIVLGLSCEDTLLLSATLLVIGDFERALAARAPRCKLLVSTLTTRRASQMENHKRSLILDTHTASAIRNSDWLIFSDDDDEWHPRRVSCYLHGLHSIAPQSAPGSPIACPIDGDTKRQHNQYNYVSYMVPARTFRRYLNRAPSHVLQHRFADVHWVRCLAKETPSILLLKHPDPSFWNYRWRVVQYPTNSTSREDPSLPEHLRLRLAVYVASEHITAFASNIFLFLANHPVEMQTRRYFEQFLRLYGFGGTPHPLWDEVVASGLIGFFPNVKI